MVDDTRSFTIHIQGDLLIKNIIADDFVDLNTPFTMQYTVENKTTAPLTVYGVLVNEDTSRVFFQSYWTDTFTGDKTVAYLFNGTTRDLHIMIRVGVL